MFLAGKAKLCGPLARGLGSVLKEIHPTPALGQPQLRLGKPRRASVLSLPWDTLTFTEGKAARCSLNL